MAIKYMSKRILMPELNLDFELLAKEKDSKQFDTYLNVIFSMFKQNNKKGKIKVYDYISSLKS